MEKQLLPQNMQMILPNSKQQLPQNIEVLCMASTRHRQGHGTNGTTWQQCIPGRQEKEIQPLGAKLTGAWTKAWRSWQQHRAPGYVIITRLLRTNKVSLTTNNNHQHVSFIARTECLVVMIVQ
jgi:hypothetical protein